MPVPPLGRLPLGAALTIALSVVALAGVTGLLREPHDATAQAPGPPVTRVVFAIDNSGSMFGIGGERASDPDQQRIAGVRSLIDVLQGFLDTSGEQRVVELAALSFGGEEPQVLSPLESVLGDRLKGRLQARQEEGGTDFRGALCGAWTLATREKPPTGAGCPEPSPTFISAAGEGGDPTSGTANERLLVVLITDGSPAPAGSDLAFDGNPPASACERDTARYDANDGDAYLCALAETWRALRAERTAELAVIGLDEPGRWFSAAEPYWQRVAQCGGDGQPDCTDRVVRSLDPDELAEWILRTFPGVDLCEAIRGETFNCDVPGGLVSVRFQIVGLAAGATSEVMNPDRDRYDSKDDPAELTRFDATTHVWRFEQPGAGVWAVTGALDPARQARVIVAPDPAHFDITVQRWDSGGLALELTLHPTSSGRVAVPSLLTQPYRVQLLRSGATVREEAGRRLEHAGGDAFTLTAASFAATDDEEAVYEVELYLRTLLVGRTSLSAGDADDGGGDNGEGNGGGDDGDEDEDNGDNGDNGDDGDDGDPQVACLAEWAGEPGVAPRWRPALRLGFPLPLRFRDSAIWSATVGPAECAAAIEADADVLGCDGCSASGTGPPPLTLDVPTDGLPGGPVERRVSWYAPSSGVEDAATEEVRLSDSVFLSTEPYWATALHLLALALVLGGISALAVRMPLQWRPGEEPARPIDLVVPDERFREVRIVRLGLIVWRRVGHHPDRDEPGRLLTLRSVFFGPLVVRDTGEDAPARARWVGTPTAEVTTAEASRLDLRRAPSRRGSS